MSAVMVALWMEALIIAVGLYGSTVCIYTLLAALNFSRVFMLKGVVVLHYMYIQLYMSTTVGPSIL